MFLLRPSCQVLFLDLAEQVRHNGDGWCLYFQISSALAPVAPRQFHEEVSLWDSVCRVVRIGVDRHV